MMMKMLQQLLVLALVCFRNHVVGYPTMAGGCLGGQAAVGGKHLEMETEVTGSLHAGNIKLKIDGTQVATNAPIDLLVGYEYEWELFVESGDHAFRGFLLRLDGGTNNIDTTDALYPIPGQGGNVQIADPACVSIQMVGGACHRSRALKTTVSGLLRIDAPSNNMKLDVTVVIEARQKSSIYYYSQYTINAVTRATPAPTYPSPPPTSGKNPYYPPTDDPYYPPTDPPTYSYYPPPTDPYYPPTDEPTYAYYPPPTDPYYPPTDPPTSYYPDLTDEPTGEYYYPPTDPPTYPYYPPPTDPVYPPPTDPYYPPPTEPGYPQPTYDPYHIPAPTDPVYHPYPTYPYVPPGAPTYAPTLPHLQSVYPKCNVNETCGICQGDCDSDVDCAGHLACFHRDQWDFTRVPGCLGQGQRGRDYCFDPIAHPYALQLYPYPCSAEYPCDKCKGDCSADTDCKGTLECFQRPQGGNETIPGCYGHGIPGQDYCFDRNDFGYYPGYETLEPTNEYTYNTWEPTGEGTTYEPTSEWTYAPEFQTYLTDTYCAKNRPCRACQGDCNYDWQCAGDLECFPRRVGSTSPVPGCGGLGIPGNDYCYSPDKNTLRPRIQPCTVDNPCQKCQGDCDGNAGCAGGLLCFHRQTGDGANVPGCTGPALANMDYCYDPADGDNYWRRLRGNAPASEADGEHPPGEKEGEAFATENGSESEAAVQN